MTLHSKTLDPHSSRPLRESMPDHASDVDVRSIPIERVGIHGLTYPIQVMDKQNETQATVASIDAAVGLSSNIRGTHMSRFVEILDQARGEITLRSIPTLLAEIQRRLNSDAAHIEVRFPYFMTKRAPVSRAMSLMSYPCAFKASRLGTELSFTLCVQVPVTSLCPCSKAVSNYGAHNQRSTVDVEIQGTEFVWIEDVVHAVEQCASAPLYALLKREDEKYVTEQAYDNPRFVEDLVREALLALRQLPGASKIRVSAENHESIHNHSAYASLTWASDAASSTESIPDCPADGQSHASFGSWLKALRKTRRMSQQALAHRIGTSASYLSRVESGEKTMSSSSLVRLANALGQDPVKVQLRAGVIHPDLVSRIASDPESFLAWAFR